MRGGRITLYLTMYNDVEWAAARVMSSYQLSYSQRFKITNFPGSLVIMPFSVRPGTCHGFGGKYPIYLVYFIGPDGYEWYGRCAEHNQILRCQRVKKQSLSMAGIVWTTQDGRQLPIGSMEPAHLDNTIRKINREVAAGSKWGRLHLKYVAPMQKILDAKRARGDPERYRDGAESYSLSNEDPDYGD